MAEDLRQGSLLPPYMAYPRFLLNVELSETAKLVYVLLLDRARLSMKNPGWTDGQGRVFIYFPISALAEQIGKSEMTVKQALRNLEDLGLIRRKRQQIGKPNCIYVRIPTENCPYTQTDFCPPTDENLSTSNNHNRNNKEKIVVDRNYDYSEGESL